MRFSDSENHCRIVQALADYDLSITDLARDVLGMDSIEVHQHIADARYAVGVNTNIQLVIYYYKLGYITL